ncbi:ATP-binding protein [Kitasatospora sp. NPDC004745]|uniref:ATP-binding protein n=1 Tax=Kitasatospora sp. NPDC004745 TaxID=3364019 RepID=UPI0036C4C293
MTSTADVEFTADPRQISHIRCWARAALRNLGLDDRHQYDVELVLSELGSNAVVHACHGGQPAVTLTAGMELRPDGTLRVSVTDPSPARPALRTSGEGDTGGRGLHLVAAYSRTWGVDDLGPAGKRVWAELDLPTTAHPCPAAAADTQVRLQIAALRADTTVKAVRPRPRVHSLPGRPALRRRIPAA